MDTVLQDKIASLRKIYTSDEDLEFLSSSEKQFRKDIKLSKLLQNEIITEIVSRAQKHVDSISFLLANDEEMPAEDRAKLFRERKVHQWWIDRLSGKDAEQRIKSFVELVDNKLKETEYRR